MTPEEIKRIERELNVDLPTHYVTFLSKFDGLNNPEVDIGHLLYSSADDLIEMNRMIGFHLTDKIIKNKLIIGDNGGGDFYLIDLVDKSNKTVYVFDHEETVENCFDKEKGTLTGSDSRHTKLWTAIGLAYRKCLNNCRLRAFATRA